jgi:hypothetical protein
MRPYKALQFYILQKIWVLIVFGFLESFSARKFCRLCEAVKGDKKFRDTDFEMRTPVSYGNAVASLQSKGYNSPATRIKASCILNEIPTFHATTNYALDVMHDVPAGIVPYELELILQELINQGYFSG